METSVTSYWMALNFRYVPEKGKKGKRRDHIPLAEGCHNMMMMMAVQSC